LVVEPNTRLSFRLKEGAYMIHLQGPFAVVASHDSKTIPVTDESYRLLIFDDVEVAREFAFGLLAAGFASAKSYTVDELRLFDLLDAREAPSPYAPEVETWRDLTSSEKQAEAFALGESLGAKWRAGLERMKG
jgi:hypothetical protein